jgi:hypothetical protein
LERRQQELKTDPKILQRFAFPIPADTFLLNARFLTWLIAAACLAGGVYVAR